MGAFVSRNDKAEEEMGVESPSETISGQELFDAAISDSKPEVEANVPTEPKPEETGEEIKAEERQRDQKGRFVSKAPEEAPAEPEPALEVAPPPKEEKQDHRIPLTELLNEREKRQNAERERQMLEQQLWQLQQSMQQRTQEPIDIFADPAAYQSHVEQTMAEKMRSMEANFSLRLAHHRHGDMFMEAFNDVLSRPMNDPVRQQVINSPDPGETLVALFQKERLMSEVGPDPNAYVQKKLEEALNDPQFLAKALEKAKGVARTQPTQKIDLPPSLNKAAAASKADDTTDMSGGSLYSYATR